MITKIFDALGRHIVQSIPGITRHIGYGRELNSYPSFSILRPNTASYSSNIRHLSDGQKLYIIRCGIRLYNRSSIETALDDIELLARNFENAIASFPRAVAINALEEGGFITTQQGELLTTQDAFVLVRQNQLSYVEDARVISLETDEGLFAPASICDIEIEMFYVEA